MKRAPPARKTPKNKGKNVKAGGGLLSSMAE